MSLWPRILSLIFCVGVLLCGCRSHEERVESATVTVQGPWEGREGQFVGVSYEKCPGNIDYVRLEPASQGPAGPPRPTPVEKACLQAIRPDSNVKVKLTATVNRLSGLHSWNVTEIAGCNVEGMGGGFFSGHNAQLCPWMSKDAGK